MKLKIQVLGCTIRSSIAMWLMATYWRSCICLVPKPSWQHRIFPSQWKVLLDNLGLHVIQDGGYEHGFWSCTAQHHHSLVTWLCPNCFTSGISVFISIKWG